MYPPHPYIKISPKCLEEYEKTKKWIAQRKFNGTNILINIDIDRNIKLLTRHGTPPKLFSLSKSHIDQILSLNLEDKKEYWFNGELLDHKTKNYKGKIILFDIIYEGGYLVRVKQVDRLQILSDICGNPIELEESNKIALKVTSDIWLAENWNDNFNFHFEEFINLDEIEGLMLREKESLNNNFGAKKYDVSWMVKCRKPHSGDLYRY
jgi:hypothetical protein